MKHTFQVMDRTELSKSSWFGFDRWVEVERLIRWCWIDYWRLERLKNTLFQSLTSWLQKIVENLLFTASILPLTTQLSAQLDRSKYNNISRFWFRNWTGPRSKTTTAIMMKWRRRGLRKTILRKQKLMMEMPPIQPRVQLGRQLSCKRQDRCSKQEVFHIFWSDDVNDSNNVFLRCSRRQQSIQHHRISLSLNSAIKSESTRLW